MDALNQTHDATSRGLRAWIGAPVELIDADRRKRTPHSRAIARLTGANLHLVTLQCAEPHTLHAGKRVIALVYTGTEIAYFESTVEKLLPAPSQQLQVVAPAMIKFHRLRREARMPVCVPAAATLADGTRAEAMLIDFSEAGCHVTSETNLGTPGTRLRIEFTLPGDDGRQVRIDGEIRWTNQVAAEDLPHYACGIRFDAAKSQGWLLEQLTGQTATA